MASDKLLHLTDENFAAEVLQSPLPTLVDFWATWCAPCRAIAPHVEAIAKDYEGRIRVGKLDIDKSPKIPTDYDVRSIPTLLLFHGGQVIGPPLIGGVSKAKLEQSVKEWLARIK